MGHERKRGKLGDLNAALRGGGWQSFDHVVGNVETLGDVRYVITLDTDTQLPRDAARELVGTMAHPLNRPRLDVDGQRVCAGYGILQPRMATSLSGAGRSHYARLFGSDPGLILIRTRSLTFIRICSAKAPLLAKGFTTLMLLVPRSKVAFPTIESSVTICWKAVTRAAD